MMATNAAHKSVQTYPCCNDVECDDMICNDCSAKAHRNEVLSRLKTDTPEELMDWIRGHMPIGDSLPGRMHLIWLKLFLLGRQAALDASTEEVAAYRTADARWKATCSETGRRQPSLRSLV
jgi:hypothetical protein